MRLREGKGELNLWLTLRDFAPVALTTDSDLRDVRVDGAPMPGVAAPQLQLQRLQARLRWQRLADGWALQVPRLRLKTEDGAQQLDGLQLQIGKQLRVNAGAVQAGTALRGLALSNLLEPGLRRWLFLSRPQLEVRRLQLAGERDGPCGRRVNCSRWVSPAWATRPACAAWAGALKAMPMASACSCSRNGSCSSIGRPALACGMTCIWPDRSWGGATRAAVGGSERRRCAWKAPTTQACAAASGSRATVRVPWLQLAAKLDDVPMTAAKRFWIHSKMSKGATDWLDMALAGGQVRGGVGLVTGDLDDWPFDNNDGRFEATGHITNGDIRFQHDWPLMSQVDADIAFIGPGFDMRGRGDLAGVAVQKFEAGIPDFGHQPLYVRADAPSEAGKLLAMLRQSPLHKDYGDTLDNLAASGPAHVTFDLLQPLHQDEGEGHLQGTVDLAGVKLVDKRFQLTLTICTGRRATAMAVSAPRTWRCATSARKDG